MPESKVIAGLGVVDEHWEAAIKESGFRYLRYQSSDEIMKAHPDFVLLDGRQGQLRSEIGKIKGKTHAPILSLIQDNSERSDLLDLKAKGSHGYIMESTPPEEIVFRLRSMAENSQELDQKMGGESRSSRRVWFQQSVNFRIFDKTYDAWSTTLSETGIFLRTSLSFPLYSVMHLNFKLWGDSTPFECDGVIVRQEAEGPIKGLGVMFQNLKGENIRRLEAFFEIYQ